MADPTRAMDVLPQIATICLLVLNTLPQGAFGDLRATPLNTAGLVDEEVDLGCRGADDNSVAVTWALATGAGAADYSTISINDVVSDIPNKQFYGVAGDDTLAEYNLNINLQPVTSGRYRCQDIIGPHNAFAHVIVLGAETHCNDTVNQDRIIEEDETVTYTCEVSYNSGDVIDWPPIITWSGPDGMIPGIDQSTPGTVKTYIKVIGASKTNGAVFSAKTHFEAYGADLHIDDATNVPSFTRTHAFKLLMVNVRDRKLSGGAIAGICVGVVAFLCLTVALVIGIKKKVSGTMSPDVN